MRINYNTIEPRSTRWRLRGAVEEPREDASGWTRFVDRVHCLHADQRGTISIVSVFAMLLLAMVLGMLLNIGREVDGKIKMQNAADASTYSGGVVLARGMNTLAFTNHLLSDVFALTAFMREARDRNAESATPPIFQAWSKAGQLFSTSGFEKFDRLGAAIQQEVPLEQEMVRSYSEWAAASSDLILPVLEDILAEEQIPEFQRALVAATPQLAQQAMGEISRRHGVTSPDRGDMAGVLWRTMADPVGGQSETVSHTLPVVDPVLDAEPNQEEYFNIARRQRNQLARRYLDDWNRPSMRPFDVVAKMSQFGTLWRGFTCGQLDKLLNEEYPDTNMPHVIRTQGRDVAEAGRNQHLEDNFMFVGTTYWPKLAPILPGLFKHPVEGDSQAFAQVMLFVPEPRLVKGWRKEGDPVAPTIDLGGVPGDYIDIQGDAPPPDGDEDEWHWYIVRQSRPRNWDLLNQNWMAQLAPATASSLASILSTDPGTATISSTSGGSTGTGRGHGGCSEFLTAGVRTPNLRGVSDQQLRELNTH